MVQVPDKTATPRRGRRHPLVQGMRVVLIGLLGAWLAVLLQGGVRVTTELATLHGAVRPAWRGRTVIKLPPFGALSAPTHRLPLVLEVEVEELHLDQVITWAQNFPTRSEALARLRADVTQLAWTLVWQTVLWGGGGALVLGLLLRLRPAHLAGSLGVGLAGVILPLALTGMNYRPSAFANPTYYGELTRAPALFQAMETLWRGNHLEAKLPVVAERLTRFYRQLDNGNPNAVADDAELLTVLHISDLHNNPLGMRFALDMAREYRADLVVMTGDLSDVGHPLETALLQQWSGFRVPVVAITGNHDSRAIAQRLAALPRVTVLDRGETVTLQGLTFMGFGDPRADRAAVGDVKPRAGELRALREQILQRLADGRRPDILLVHDESVAKALLGKVPVILTGHTHAPRLLQRPGSVLVNPGTTGAAGVRYFTGPRQPPYGAAILRFTRQAPHRLQIIDTIALEQPAGNFSITRRNVE